MKVAVTDVNTIEHNIYAISRISPSNASAGTPARAFPPTRQRSTALRNNKDASFAAADRHAPKSTLLHEVNWQRYINQHPGADPNSNVSLLVFSFSET